MKPGVVQYLRIVAIGAVMATIPLPIKINNFAIIFAALVAIFTYPWRNLKNDLNTYRKILLPGLIFLCLLAGMLYTTDTRSGWKLIERSTSLIGLPVLVLLLYDVSLKTKNTLFRIFEAACFIFFMYCLYIALTKVIATGSWYNPEKIEQITDRRYYYFLNVELLEPVGISPIYLGMYINLCIAFSTMRLFVERNVSFLNVGQLLVFSGFQLMVGSINSIVVMGMIWVLVWLFGQAKANNLNFRTSLVVLVPLVILISVIATVKPLRQRFIVNTEYQYEWAHVGYWTGITFRLAIWSCAKEVINENFLTGVGTGDADLALNAKYTEKNFVFGTMENYNAHNQYMQTWIMHGIVGVLLLVLVVLAPFYWSWRQGDILLGMFALIIALALCTEVTFGTQKGIAFFAVFFALLTKDMIASRRQLQDPTVNA